MHLQKDGTHTCRKAMENKGLVLVPNNMFDTCLQTQQPFWRKSIFPCLAAGSVLLGQLRLFVSGWSPTCSCCQNSYQYTQFSMRHVIPLLQLNSICPPSLRCSPSSSCSACTAPLWRWHTASLPCASCVRSGFTVHAAFTEGGVYQHRSP